MEEKDTGLSEHFVSVNLLRQVAFQLLFIPLLTSLLTSLLFAEEGQTDGAPGAVTTQEVTVSDKPIPASLSASSSNVTIISKEQLRQTPALVLDDVLRQIPGFNTFRRSSSLVTAPAQDPEAQGVTLRGVGPGGASRALVLLDGVPINDGFGGWLYWGEIPIESVERIEVIRGATSAVFGNFAEGGVINIVTSTPGKTAAHLKTTGGNRGSTDNDLALTAVRGPLKIGLRGNLLHTDGWNIISTAQRGPLDRNSGLDRKVFNGNIGYDVSSKFSLFLRGSYYDESRNLGTVLRTSNAGRGFIAGGGTLETSDGSLWQMTVFQRRTRYAEVFSEATEDRSAEIRTQMQAVPSTDTGGSLLWSRSLFSGHFLTAGLDSRFISGESQDDLFDATGSGLLSHNIASGKQFFGGAFVQDIYKPMQKLTLTGGLRLNYYQNYAGTLAETSPGAPGSTTHFNNQSRVVLNPKLALQYDVAEGLALRSAAYTGFRAPTLAELYRPSSVEGLVLRQNPNLGPENLQGVDVGFDYTQISGLALRVTGYWNYLHNAIGNVTTAHDPVTDEDTERTRVNIGRARVRGVEADLSYDVREDLTLFANYLYSEAVLVDAPLDQALVGKRLTQVPLHSASIGFRYHNPQLVNALVQWRYIGAQFEDADNRDKLASYYVVDLTVSKTIPPRQFASWPLTGEMFLSIQNLFDREYDVDKGGGILKVGTPFLIFGGLRGSFG